MNDARLWTRACVTRAVIGDDNNDVRDVGIVCTSTHSGQRVTCIALDPEYVRMLQEWMQTNPDDPTGLAREAFDIILDGWPEDWLPE